MTYRAYFDIKLKENFKCICAYLQIVHYQNIHDENFWFFFKSVKKSHFLWNKCRRTYQNFVLSIFFIYFLFCFAFLTLLHKINVCAGYQNLCWRVSMMLKYGKYANMPKRDYLIQKMANVVEASNSRYIVYLFSWINIKLSLKWVIDEPSRTKLTFSYKIRLKEKIS